jgi:ABC-type glycerol-3-phosphate transport system permease component
MKPFQNFSFWNSLLEFEIFKETSQRQPEKPPGSMFAVIPVILIFIFPQKFYIQGLTSGAIKG